MTWQEMSRRMYVPFHADGVISQFEGYEDLEELDWDGLRAAREHPAARPDPARGGRRPEPLQGGQAGGHAHAVLPVPRRRAGRLFEQLGYELRPTSVAQDDRLLRPADLPRLDAEPHRPCRGSGSIDPSSSWERFLVALESDIDDIQGGTTAEGIHMGVMAGTLDLIQRIYLGTEIRDDVMHFDPRLHDGSTACRCRCSSAAPPIRVTLENGELTVAALADGATVPIRVGCRDDVRELAAAGMHVPTLGGSHSRR